MQVFVFQFYCLQHLLYVLKSKTTGKTKSSVQFVWVKVLEAAKKMYSAAFGQTFVDVDML